VVRPSRDSYVITTADSDRMPPGQNMDDYLTQFRSGMWRLNYRLSPEGKRRFFDEFLPLLHDTMHTTLGDREHEAWYLVYIGTKPSGRGKGHARKLIEQVTKLADREGRACYLESSNACNPPIYRRFGFEACRTIQLQRGGRNIPLDIMVREPLTQEKKRVGE
jgi:ribosomal protein S18 acetylase RimI-like enzyme